MWNWNCVRTKKRSAKLQGGLAKNVVEKNRKWFILFPLFQVVNKERVPNSCCLFYVPQSHPHICVYFLSSLISTDITRDISLKLIQWNSESTMGPFLKVSTRNFHVEITMTEIIYDSQCKRFGIISFETQYDPWRWRYDKSQTHKSNDCLGSKSERCVLLC